MDTQNRVFTNLHSVGDVISPYCGDSGVVLLQVLMMVMVLAEGVCHGVAEAIVAQ